MTVDGVFFEFNIFQSFYREKSTTPSRDSAQKLKKCKITSRVFLELYVFQSSHFERCTTPSKNSVQNLQNAKHHPGISAQDLTYPAEIRQRF